ncbi:hypothetical protein L6164_015715 [Bauhinia variegata]|uniref:Uncharacterized protein n=1 Tax=Bauhinia variegata TaxID=167791 RepID=A0ACB9NNJ5_BAUVA|nr:hypothetical protein L6164_015715 [Bauhinia variegata]
MDTDYHYQRQSSLKHKLKSSICCFAGTMDAPLENGEHYYDKLQTPKTPRTPPIWHKKSGQYSPDSNRQRSHGHKSRMCRKHRQSHSADFTYDPSSYALNFEDHNRTDDDEFPFRDFSSRLPASPSPLSQSPSSVKYPEDSSVRVPIVAHS